MTAHSHGALDAPGAHARITLSHLFEPADAQVGSAVGHWGADAVLSALRAGRGASASALAVTLRRSDVESAMRAADAEVELATRLGISFIVPSTVQWPTQLNDLGHRAPLLLRARGVADVRRAAAHSVAIVGARACTRYGVSVADSMAAHLGANGWCVVSGAAFGIDVAAHLGALAVGGTSIAVSAGGADLAHPRAHENLFSMLATAGAVVSEVPLGSHPTKARFLIRNRLIAALTMGVVVVEAAARSGARSTVREAQDLNRIVAAVPGPVTSAASVSCHQLIRDGGAVLVTNGREVEELVGPIGGYAAETPS